MPKLPLMSAGLPRKESRMQRSASCGSTPHHLEKGRVPPRALQPAEVAHQVAKEVRRVRRDLPGRAREDPKTLRDHQAR